ncbi:restriction endonuclease subunit S [Bacteroides uniformis]|uniref:restriction endonuclease subunit S n=1 Tax=Bacteroides uniformis TaxID=820 RepID=UPI00216AD896|nr:restriction endonuclease subunit S [Bacteroides uniformis]
MGEISNYGECNNVSVDSITDDDWVLELEDLEKDTAKIIQTLSRSKRSIKGVRHRFNKGDILYSKLRTYLNKVLVAPQSGYCTTEIMPFNSYCNVSSYYLNHVLRSAYFLDYTQQCGYGVKMPRLSTTDACNGMIPLPPLAEQKRIVKEIEHWFSLIDVIESGKEDLQATIKQAKSKILDLAIHGKLVPQDPNDEPASELLKRINSKAEITCDNGHYTQLPDGWTACRLEQVADILDNLRKPINSSERDSRIRNRQIDELYPYYGATGQVGLIDDYIINGNYLLLGEDGAPFLDKNAIKAYSISGKSWVNNHAHILSPKIDFEFLQYSLNQIDYSEYVNGSTRLKLTQTDMRSIKIMLPPLAEQKRIKSKIQILFSQLDLMMESL